MKYKAIFSQKLFLFFVLSAIFLIRTDFIFALENKYPEIFGLKIHQNPTLPEYAKYFFNLGIFISIGLAILTMTLGGILYSISSLAPRFKEEGKEWIKSSLLGLIIVLSSYIITYTINPDLVVFKLGYLPPNYYQPPPPPDFNNLPNVQVEIYEEIPIGTLTEFVLAKHINCYDFDEKGDHIDGHLQTKEDIEETYMEKDRDRIYCLNKLAEAVEKKMRLFEKLSKKLVELMNLCDCYSPATNSISSVTDASNSASSFLIYSTSSPPTSPPTSPTSSIPGVCNPGPNEKKCQDSKIFSYEPSTCEGLIKCGFQRRCVGQKCTTCPDGIKDKIEKGPICLEGEYNKSKKGCFKKIKEEGKEKEIEVGKPYKGLEEFRSNKESLINELERDVCWKEGKILNDISDESQCSQKDGQWIKLIKKDRWEKLKLIEKLVYLREKIDQLNSKIKEDLNRLENAETALSDCYLAKSSAEFLKIKEKTNKNSKIIETTKTISISKYCKGFEWQNYNFFHNCRKEHPGITPDSYQCFKNANTSNEKLADCFYGKEFKNCLKDKRNKCIENCENAYSPEEPEYKQCLSECNNNSKGFVEYLNDKDEPIEGKEEAKKIGIKANTEQCYSNLQRFRDCAQNSVDYFIFKKCADNSFKCKFASDQHAGYPDVLLKPHDTGTNFSSLYIYQNPQQQICEECNKLIITPITSSPAPLQCSIVYPQVQKGPSCSKCPDCPLILEEKKSTTNPKTSLETSLIISGGQCSEFAYNEDPLTFYCRTNPIWWEDSGEKREKPMGNNWFCRKSTEVPVGQTVDNTERWANLLIQRIENFRNKTNEAIKYIRQIGNEKGYGECDSLCATDEPTCSADCDFSKPTLLITIPGYEKKVWLCSCIDNPCKGNPYQKIINLLMGKKAGDKCPKNVEYKGVPGWRLEIKDALKNLKELVISRSDILKQLIYSRKKMNEGGVTMFADQEKSVKILNCERVKDEIIPHISDKDVIINKKRLKKNCYGKDSGKILNVGKIADNWFVCEKIID